jgi:protein-S-isoprenylcysteine O-methyltransferase Ste14
MVKSILNKIYNVPSKNPGLRIILTPVIGILFAFGTAMFVYVPIYLEGLWRFPHLLNPPFNYIISLPFAAVGAVLMIWTSVIFFMKKGTPVPVNPPPVLIAEGPYKYLRNPMHGGLFLLMFGIGIYYSSVFSVLVFTPLYIWIDVLMLKKIEEPELESRLGDAYIRYKKSVPMFFWWRKRKSILN